MQGEIFSSISSVFFYVQSSNSVGVDFAVHPSAIDKLITSNAQRSIESTSTAPSKNSGLVPRVENNDSFTYILSEFLLKSCIVAFCIKRYFFTVFVYMYVLP